MGIIKDWMRRYSQPRQPVQRDPDNLPRESTLTAVSGGMGSTELLIRLEIALGDIKSKTPIVNHAYDLASLSHNLQARLLSDLTELADLSYSHGVDFLAVAADALTGMEQAQYDKWVVDIKSLLEEGYDDAATELIQKYTSYTEAPFIVNLVEITDTLEKLIYSICETDVPIMVAAEAVGIPAYTDGSQFYLPAKISYFNQYDENYRLYKILTFHLLEQIQLGTLEAFDKLNKAVEQHGAEYLKQFSSVETLRIDKAIKSDYPGIWRDIEKLHQLSDINYPYEYLANSKLDTVFDTLEHVDAMINKPMNFPELVYQPDYLREMVAVTSKSEFSSVSVNEKESEDEEVLERRKIKEEYRDPLAPDIKEISDPSTEDDIEHDTLPPDWLELPVSEPVDSEYSIEPLTKIYSYKEWDTSLQLYRKDWCQVREIILQDTPEYAGIEVSQVLRHTEFRIKKILDLLTNEQRLMRFQSDGDDIDIDAWVSARSNRTKRADDFQNIYSRNNKSSRHVAIAFAVDISGSTRGWKNTAIRQSTWLLCKTLSRLDDQYAVYAFSGSGRKGCHIYPVKTFNEAYGSRVKSRIFAMQPKQYTRMGAAIRHLSDLLSKTSAKTRILFILTDGKPDDIDSYRGQYAIEDTRRAINEARSLALNPFVLTFDKDGMDYLPHMLGSNRYQLISDVSQLPIQISTIYKNLTT